MSSIIDFARDVKTGLFSDQDAGEKRVTTVGTWGSGKSTILGKLALTCETLSANDRNFTYTIDEKSSGICARSSNLRQARFPPATPPGNIYEADLVLRWKNKGVFSGWKTVRVPFCETAGEDIQKIIGKFGKGEYHTHPYWGVAKELSGKILASNGFMLICPVSRALLFHRMPDEWEKEPPDLPVDPDVNIVRILREIHAYKKQARSPRIEGMAIVLTKYDLVQEYLQRMGLDLLKHPQVVQEFMNTFFPQTAAELKFRGLDNVAFFPSFVQVRRTAEGRIVKYPDDGSAQIEMHPTRPRMPIYSEAEDIRLLGWIRETFAK